jgi:hypothetical protein
MELAVQPLTFNNPRFYHTCSSLGRDAEIMSYAARISTPDHEFQESGDKGTRTPDPLRAKQVLSQLSYAPDVGLPPLPHNLVLSTRHVSPPSSCCYVPQEDPGGLACENGGR